MRGLRGRTAAVLFLVVACGSLAGGCFRRQFPERRQYVLQVEREAPPRSASAIVIKVGRVRAEPQYERKGFVYRTGEATYADDFYNAFYVSPAQMVRSTMQNWIAASQLFASVADVDSLVSAEWLLESRLLEFYVDKRSPEAAQAVVSLAVTLVDAMSSPPRPIYEATYDETSIASGSSGRRYVDAWSEALSRVCERLEADLALAVSSTGSS